MSVDQGQQVFPAALDGFEPVDNLAAQVPILEELGVSQDGI